jgi:hypothetical protein
MIRNRQKSVRSDARRRSGNNTIYCYAPKLCRISRRSGPGRALWNHTTWGLRRAGTPGRAPQQRRAVNAKAVAAFLFAPDATFPRSTTYPTTRRRRFAVNATRHTARGCGAVDCRQLRRQCIAPRRNVACARAPWTARGTRVEVASALIGGTADIGTDGSAQLCGVNGRRGGAPNKSAGPQRWLRAGKLARRRGIFWSPVDIRLVTSPYIPPSSFEAWRPARESAPKGTCCRPKNRSLRRVIQDAVV